MNRTGLKHEIKPTAVDVECVFKTNASIGEGPVWSVKEQRLYWVDIPEKKFHVFNPADGSNKTFELPESVTSATPRKGGGLVLSLRKNFAYFDPTTGKLDELSDVEPDKPGFPAIPGATVVKVTNRVAPPGDWVSSAPHEDAYRTLVCKVNGDGNEAAGVRLPDIAVPLATYSGWNEYKPQYPAGELADRDGSCLPFAADKTAREASGDPRLSLEERYHDHAGYVQAVKAAAAKAVSEGFLLQADADKLVRDATASNVLAPQATASNDIGR